MRYVTIVMHGLAGAIPFISAGTSKIDRLIDNLAGGIESKDFIQTRYRDALSYIMRMQDAHGEIEVILIGHSMGVYRCIWLAKQCLRLGITVRYMAAIDPTPINRLLGMKPMEVPGNVVEVDEFWASVGFPAAARAADRSGRRGGRLVTSGWRGIHGLHPYDDEHIALASNVHVVDTIIRRVKDLFRRER